MLKQSFVINSKKFNGKTNKSWSADLVQIREPLFIFRGVFDSQIIHSHLGIIRPGTISYEYYWLDRWYNVFKFFEPDGSFRNFYCNINMPPKIGREVLDYVDLDIDVIIRSDSSHEVLDLDEFAENSKQYDYSPELIQNVQTALETVLQNSKNKIYPFDSMTLD